MLSCFYTKIFYMIELKNITKAFKEDINLSKKNILENVSINLSLGKTYGLFGKNGSGKTSILKIIMKLINPDSGKVLFDRESLSFKEISFSSEKMSFFPDLKCKDFFLTIKEIHNIPTYKFENKINYFSKVFEIENSLNKKLKYFSQGMLKKVSFIACLLNDPKFILLDEPFSGLDLDARVVLKKEIDAFKNNGGGVLLTSHMFEDVSILIDDWFYIKKGKIIESSLSKPFNRYNFFDGYHIEVFSPTKDISFSKKEVSNFSNRYIFKVLENEKDAFLNEIISKGCNIEAVVLNKFKLGEYFLSLEGG